MPIEYFSADDVKHLVVDIVNSIPLDYIDVDRVFCFRSRGSRSKRGLARCYSFLKVWQKALNLPPYYLIEVISERFDRLSDENKKKVLIHELLHIPKTFGGGLRPHAGYVNKRRIDSLYECYIRSKRSK